MREHHDGAGQPGAGERRAALGAADQVLPLVAGLRSEGGAGLQRAERQHRQQRERKRQRQAEAYGLDVRAAQESGSRMHGGPTGRR